jgi:hypothetical protein
MKLVHKLNAFATHQPVLIEIFKHLSKEGSVLELGSGLGSTELLHNLCLKDNRKLVTVDDSEEWLQKYENQFTSPNHKYKLLPIENINYDKEILDTKWELIFIDQGSWENRVESVKVFKDICKFLVIHDSDYFPSTGLMGKVITKAIPLETPAVVDHSDNFKYFKEFYPSKPWPAESGPPTLVGSNFVPIDFEVNMDIDFIEI